MANEIDYTLWIAVVNAHKKHSSPEIAKIYNLSIYKVASIIQSHYDLRKAHLKIDESSILTT